MKKCPFCAEEVNDAAVKCKHCGGDVSSVSPVKVNPLKRKINTWYVIAIFLVPLLYFAGRYHVITDIPEVLQRSSFGFSDFIATTNECTSIPYIVAITKHQSLCTALHDAGYVTFPSEF